MTKLAGTPPAIGHGDGGPPTAQDRNHHAGDDCDIVSDVVTTKGEKETTCTKDCASSIETKFPFEFGSSGLPKADARPARSSAVDADTKHIEENPSDNSTCQAGSSFKFTVSS